MADLLNRMLEGKADMGHANDNTLDTSMRGYVIPVFVDILWIISWAMVIMKTMGGSLSSGRGGGWCRTFCLICCVFQSFYGFLVMHSMVQEWTLVASVFPVLGFIAFQGNNRSWLLGYCMVSLFAWNYSGLNFGQNVWNYGAGITSRDAKGFTHYGDITGATWNTSPTSDNDEAAKPWQWDEKHHSACWAKFGHNSFCKWGWARLLFVFSTLNILSQFFTVFAAFSWFAEGSSGGGVGV